MFKCSINWNNEVVGDNPESSHEWNEWCVRSDVYAQFKIAQASTYFHVISICIKKDEKLKMLIPDDKTDYYFPEKMSQYDHGILEIMLGIFAFG